MNSSKSPLIASSLLAVAAVVAGFVWINRDETARQQPVDAPKAERRVDQGKRDQNAAVKEEPAHGTASRTAQPDELIADGAGESSQGNSHAGDSEGMAQLTGTVVVAPDSGVTITRATMRRVYPAATPREYPVENCGERMSCWLANDLVPGRYLISVQPGHFVEQELAAGANNLLIDLSALTSVTLLFFDSETDAPVNPSSFLYSSCPKSDGLTGTPASGAPMAQVARPLDGRVALAALPGEVLHFSASADGYHLKSGSIQLVGHVEGFIQRDVFLEPAACIEVRLVDHQGEPPTHVRSDWLRDLKLVVNGTEYSPERTSKRRGYLLLTYDVGGGRHSNWGVVPPESFALESQSSEPIGPGHSGRIVLSRL